LPQIVENARQHDMLVDVGKIAGVKRVLVVHVTQRSHQKLAGLRLKFGVTNSPPLFQPPRIGGMVSSSRRQLRLAISAQSRKRRSLERQSRTSVKRLASQPTARR
jgi:hypothetical protein